MSLLLYSAAGLSCDRMLVFLLLLWTGVSGFSVVVGLSLHPCKSSEICSDGSCGPCGGQDQTTAWPETKTQRIEYPVPQLNGHRDPESKSTAAPEGLSPASSSSSSSLSSPSSSSSSLSSPLPTVTLGTEPTLAGIATDEVPLGEFLNPGYFPSMPPASQNMLVSTETPGPAYPEGLQEGWGGFLGLVPSDAAENAVGPQHEVNLKSTTPAASDIQLNLPDLTENLASSSSESLPPSSSSSSSSSSASSSSSSSSSSSVSPSSQTQTILSESSAGAESSVAHSNVTGDLVLPDDSKKARDTGPMGGGGEPPPRPLPSSPSVVSEGPRLTPPWPSVTVPGVKTVDADWHPADDGSDWTAGGGGEEEEEGTLSTSSGGQEQTAGQHGIDVLLLVAPCLVAVMSVVGVVVVVKVATRDCKPRQDSTGPPRSQRNHRHRNRRETTTTMSTTMTEAEEDYDQVIHDHGLY